MEFEYDPKKSISNLLKHGIDFMRAQRLWDSPTVEVSVNGDYGEERFAVFGVIEGENWTAIITYRGGNIRIISVRRSKKNEVKYYDEKTSIEH